MTQYLNITIYNKLLPDLNKQSSTRPSYPQRWYSHYTVTTEGNGFHRKKWILPILKSVPSVENVKSYKPRGGTGTPRQAQEERGGGSSAQGDREEDCVSCHSQGTPPGNLKSSTERFAPNPPRPGQGFLWYNTDSHVQERTGVQKAPTVRDRERDTKKKYVKTDSWGAHCLWV